jgi:hypothetical protein
MAPKKAKQKPAKKMQKLKKATRKPARPVRKPKAKAKPAKAAPKKKAKARVIARPVKKAAAKTQKKAVAKKAPARKAPPVAKQSTATPAPKPKAAKLAPLAPPPALQRERRRLPEAEAETFSNATEDSRLMSSARTGHDELRSEMKQHTESSPAMTAGDVDAKWQDAYALGDEAPGGDNMTPDQDRVDDIGKALGIEYADDEELLGGDELAERDEHRWELDPASKDEEDDEI